MSPVTFLIYLTSLIHFSQLILVVISNVISNRLVCNILVVMYITCHYHP